MNEGMICTKRAYAAAAPEDGARFLVDRLWPRGVRKEQLHLTAWLKEVAPSNELRRRFHHDPELWPEFQRAYAAELEATPSSWQPLLEAVRRGTITLLFGARDTERNNAAALKEFLERRLRGKGGAVTGKAVRKVRALKRRKRGSLDVEK